MMPSSDRMSVVRGTNEAVRARDGSDHTEVIAGTGAPLADPSIVVDDLSGPEVAVFLQEHVDEMLSISPPESTHALDLDGLRKPEITFWTVWQAGKLVACGAIKDLGDGHAEVKSMRTARDCKRSGLASMMLAHILSEAIARGFIRISLETGAQEFFEPARRLYLKHGFDFCRPFGGYHEDSNSVFMTRTLDGV